MSDAGAVPDLRTFASLAHVLVAHASRDLRVLHIKGPAADHFGLREPHLSSDADVLCDPRDFDQLLERLTVRGWSPRKTSHLTGHTSTHSVSMIHPKWPVDIDVHRSFPGFLAESSTVFAALWDARVFMIIAGQQVPIAGLEHSILIQGAHSLRSRSVGRRHQFEWERLVNDVIPGLGPEARERLVQFAADSGASESLELLLAPAGLPMRPSSVEIDETDLRNWRRLTGSGGAPALRIVNALSVLPLRDRAKLIRAAIWPSTRDFAIDHPEESSTLRSAVLGRVKRWPRGARALSRYARAALHRRRHGPEVH